MDMRKEYGVLFWVHVLFIVAALSTPLWLDWKYIVVGVIALEIQYALAGGCVLTRKQLHSSEGFWVHYMVKLFPGIHKQRFDFLMTHILPILVIGVAFILQN